MSLRYALLGLLAEQPRSGYDLTKLFDNTLAYVWSAGHSQIYPELARLRDEGLIRQLELGPRGRKAHAITEEGLKELRRWLAETRPDRTVRDDAFLRVFFLWLMEPSSARAYIRGEAEYHRSKLAVYEQLAAEPPGASPPDRAGRISLEAGIRHERALLEWAEWAEHQLAGRRRRVRDAAPEVPG